MKCHKCGSELTQGLVTCITCGTPVNIKKREPWDTFSEPEQVNNFQAQQINNFQTEVRAHQVPVVFNQNEVKIEKKKLSKNKLIFIVVGVLLFLGAIGFIGFNVLNKKDIKPKQYIIVEEYKLAIPDTYFKKNEKLANYNGNDIFFQKSPNLTVDKLNSVKDKYISNLKGVGQTVETFSIRYINKNKILYMEILNKEKKQTAFFMDVDDMNAIVVFIEKTDNTYVSEDLLLELVDIVKGVEKNVQ